MNLSTTILPVTEVVVEVVVTVVVVIELVESVSRFIIVVARNIK